jgi:hypothetical protein
MMKRSAVVLCVVLSLACGVVAQVRTGRAGRAVTNSDLEKFRQQRLAADREYRDHYAEMGFPSPDELSAQIERDKQAHLELAEQLRQARLESERLDIERGRLSLDAARLQADIDARDDAGRVDDQLYYGGFGFGGYGYGFPSFGGFGKNFRGHFGRGFRAIPLVRYTPGGVVPAGTLFPPRFTPPFPRGGRIPTISGRGFGRPRR